MLTRVAQVVQETAFLGEYYLHNMAHFCGHAAQCFFRVGMGGQVLSCYAQSTF
jgi:hypothetical protein